MTPHLHVEAGDARARRARSTCGACGSRAARSARSAILVVVPQKALTHGRLWLWLIILSLPLAGACASYGARMSNVLQATAAGDYARAVAALDKRPEPESVLWLAERGLLLRHAGRLEESNASFAAALDRHEYLYTRSVSGEAAALAVSDAIRPYRAAGFELPFLHLYSALNYIELGDLDGALVEARALSQMLELRRMERDDPADDWGLGRLLAGLIFESAAEWNDGWIAYRASDAAYRASGAKVPAPVAEGIARTAARMGLDTPEEDRADAFPAVLAADARSTGEISPTSPGSSPGPRLVIWVEEGLVPVRQDLHIRVPILKEEEHWGEDRLVEWSDRVGRRTTEARSGGSRRSVEVAYFLDVALPVIPAQSWRPPFHASARIRGGSCGTVVLVEDVSELARRDLERRYPSIAARAAGRAILKALATREARKKTGEVGGAIANILGVATERADTRSWSVLPGRIGLIVCDAAAFDSADGAGIAGRVDPEVTAGSARVASAGSDDLLDIEVLLDRGSTVTRATGSVHPSRDSWHFFTCRFAP